MSSDIPSSTTSATGRLPHTDDPTTADDLSLGTDPPAASRVSYSPPRDVPPGSPPGPTYAPPTSEPIDASYGPPPGATYASHVDAPPPYWGGASAPTERRRRRQHWAGAILIILGLLILGSNLGLLRWARPEYVLPLILVAAGAWLLFGRGRRG